MSAHLESDPAALVASFAVAELRVETLSRLLELGKAVLLHARLGLEKYRAA